MLDELVKRLNSEEEEERLCSVYDIGEKGSSHGALHLIKRLNIEKSTAVMDAIVFMVKKMDISMALDELFLLFLSPDAYMRNAAVSIMGSDGDSAMEYLTSKLDHSDKEIRKLILDALVEIGTEEALFAIRSALYDPAPNVKITAVEYLGRLEDRDSIEDMIKLFEEDSEPMLRSSIIETLSILGKEDTIKIIMSVLLPHKDVKYLDPVYIPQLIRLTGKTGDIDDFLLITGGLNDINIYADDIMSAFTELKRRFAFKISECRLFSELMDKIPAGNSSWEDNGGKQ